MIRPGALPARADVVVIGAGLAGAATARELGAAGIRSVVLERALRPGTQASGRSAGMIREQVDDPPDFTDAKGNLIKRDNIGLLARYEPEDLDAIS